MKKIQLKMELASIIDAGEYFVKGTYNLEGDGPLALCMKNYVKSTLSLANRTTPT